MKGFILATIILLIVVTGVFINSFVLDRTIGNMAEEIREFNFSAQSENVTEEFLKLYESYKAAERYISITVSHDDLTNIDNDFNEIIGCLQVNDIQGATIAKSRLEGCFSHLWRLSSINIDSII